MACALWFRMFSPTDVLYFSGIKHIMVLLRICIEHLQSRSGSARTLPSRRVVNWRSAMPDDAEDPDDCNCTCDYFAESYGIQLIFFVLVSTVGVLAAVSVMLAILVETRAAGRPMGSMLFWSSLVSDMIALAIFFSRYLYSRTHNVEQPCKQLHLRNVPGYIGLALVTISSSIAITSNALWSVVDVLEIVCAAVLLVCATPLAKPVAHGFVLVDEKRIKPAAPHAGEPTEEPVLVQAEVVG